VPLRRIEILKGGRVQAVARTWSVPKWRLQPQSPAGLPMYVKSYRRNRMKKFISLVLAGLFLAGCNTIEGVGKDIKKGGEVIEKTAEKAK